MLMVLGGATTATATPPQSYATISAVDCTEVERGWVWGLKFELKLVPESPFIERHRPDREKGKHRELVMITASSLSPCPTDLIRK